MAGLALLILGLLLGGCKTTMPIDWQKIFFSQADLLAQEREIDSSKR